MSKNNFFSNLIGSTCPYCQNKIETGQDIRICSECSTPHHSSCWEENDGCTTFGCEQGPKQIKSTVQTSSGAGKAGVNKVKKQDTLIKKSNLHKILTISVMSFLLLSVITITFFYFYGESHYKFGVQAMEHYNYRLALKEFDNAQNNPWFSRKANSKKQWIEEHTFTSAHISFALPKGWKYQTEKSNNFKWQPNTEEPYSEISGSKIRFINKAINKSSLSKINATCDNSECHKSEKIQGLTVDFDGKLWIIKNNELRNLSFNEIGDKMIKSTSWEEPKSKYSYKNFTFNKKGRAVYSNGTILKYFINDKSYKNDNHRSITHLREPTNTSQFKIEEIRFFISSKNGAYDFRFTFEPKNKQLERGVKDLIKTIRLY